ncbi:MAG: Maf family protein [Candidatus Omnitrophota bacterium]|nr:Maf family protein [Candidatus Omnitrophota bacterium]
MKEVVLASASERRSRILSDCGIPHRVLPSGAEERMDGDREVSETVRMNAEMKAETVASGEEQAVVIGADTLVVHGNEIIGKPHGEGAARKMLGDFSGGKVEVYTGLCVIDAASGKKAVGFEKSSLIVSKLSDDEIKRYFRLLGPYDKAGGFSIEGIGSLIFDDIRGSYFNILGLPMLKLKGLFEEIGLDILDFVKV